LQYVETLNVNLTKQYIWLNIYSANCCFHSFMSLLLKDAETP
jgi:hypothetical protein